MPAQARLRAVQAERDEAHRQHDQHRLDQRVHEFVDRGSRRRVGWSCTCSQLDADRQLGFDAAPTVCFQLLAQLDDVAALGHRHAQADDFLAVVAHLVLRRVDVAALDAGEVAQAEGGAAGPQARRFSRSSTDFEGRRSTRTCRMSVGVTSTPADSTAFCVPSWLHDGVEAAGRAGRGASARTRCRASRPARRTARPWRPSGTRSNCWRTKSA